jgi:hypothetical protein
VFVRSATEFWPRATALSAVAFEPLPRAVAPLPDAVAF